MTCIPEREHARYHFLRRQQKRYPSAIAPVSRRISLRRVVAGRPPRVVVVFVIKTRHLVDRRGAL